MSRLSDDIIALQKFVNGESCDDEVVTYAILNAIDTLQLINEFAEKHDHALSLGGEYIYLNDTASVDSIELTASIFDDVYIEENSFDEDDD